jgi:predicted DNA-binding transcriptional regulator AlpA
MPTERLPALLAELAGLQAYAAALSNALSLRLLGDVTNSDSGRGNAERLLSVREAAERLGMSVDWLYRHARLLPFTRRLGSRAVKFDADGLDRRVSQRRR